MKNIYTGKMNQTLNIRKHQGDSLEGSKLFIHVVERDEYGNETIIKKSFITGEYLRELIMNDMRKGDE